MAKTAVLHVPLTKADAARLKKMARDHNLTCLAIVQQLVKRCAIRMQPVVLSEDEYSGVTAQLA